MTIQELPFFVILLLTILPITIGLILLARVINMFTTMYQQYKETNKFVSFMQIGDLLLFMVFLTVIIELVLYIIGEQPSGFSVFTFLIEDMLPLTWYTILLYGTLVNLSLLVKRTVVNE